MHKNMPSNKTPPDRIGEISALLQLGWSFWAIKNHLKKQGKSVSNGLISKIKNGGFAVPSARKKRGRPKRKLSHAQVARLKRLVLKVHPPTQNDLRRRFNCSRGCIQRAIKRMNVRLVKKPKCHSLSAATIEKRHRRSWPLYLRLRKSRWRSFITSDEAWVYLSNTGRTRSVQYISRDKKRSEATPEFHVEHPQGVMVWVGISAHGVSKPYFIEPGAKINAAYYQTKVLEPFFATDAKRLYPNGNFIFHQDSAPSHKAKSTITWFRNHQIAFLEPEKWMPSSPDAAPCDYFLWGYLKRKLNETKPRSIAGLKRAIAETLQKVPQDMIDRALCAWPKRCREVYYARGYHIERFHS